MRYPEVDYYPQSLRGVRRLLCDTLRDMRSYYIGRRIHALKRRLGLIPPPTPGSRVLAPYILEMYLPQLKPVETPLRNKFGRLPAIGSAARWAPMPGEEKTVE